MWVREDQIKVAFWYKIKEDQHFYWGKING